MNVRQLRIRRLRIRDVHVVTLAVVVALVPIVVAVARHSGGRWIPYGDNALLEIRIRDVFSIEHFPLLGTWSSASLTAGTDLNHPGPLLFLVLAVPVRVFGGGTGVALGVGLLNAACIVGCAVVARRVRGVTGALVICAVSAVLGWTMGSTMLTDVWQPHVLMFPYLFALVLAWAVASGHVRFVVPLAAVCSLLLQTHLGYAFLVPTLVLVALVGAFAVTRDVRRLLRWTGIAAGVTVVLWLPPLVEQLFGDANMSRILSGGSSESPTIGGSLALRLLGAVVALPPWWSRSSFADTIVATRYDADGVSVSPPGLPGVATAVVGIILVVAVLVAVGILARRRADRAGVVGVVVALSMTLVGLVSLTISPIGALGLTPHQMRWLWPLGAFIVFVAAAPLIAVAAQRRPEITGASLLLVTAVASVACLPAYVQPAGPETTPEVIPGTLDLADDLSTYRPEGPVRFETGNLRFAEPWSAVVMSALQQGDVDFRVTDAGWARQLGSARASDGDEQRRVVVLEGRQVLEPPSDSILIASTGPLTAAEIDELRLIERGLLDWFERDGVWLTEEAERLVDAGTIGFTREEIERFRTDPTWLVQSGAVWALIDRRALDMIGAPENVTDRGSELARQVGLTTMVQVVEAPVIDGGRQP